MQFLTTLLSGSALLAGLAAAQDIQSKPFHLSVISQNKTLNGQDFQSCHEGAAIESLCLGYGAATFHHNTTAGQQSNTKGDGVSGVLTYLLRGGNFNESEPMAFSIDPATNVGLPLFEPSYDATYVAFDKKGLMNVPTYYQDNVSPTVYQARDLYRWYVCLFDYSGYNYQTLNWVYGEGKPQNPSCQKVDVKRTFI